MEYSLEQKNPLLHVFLPCKKGILHFPLYRFSAFISICFLLDMCQSTHWIPRFQFNDRFIQCFQPFFRDEFTVDCDLVIRSEEHTSELQSRFDLVCRLLLEKK